MVNAFGIVSYRETGCVQRERAMGLENFLTDTPPYLLFLTRLS